jgi:hypothetical protein
MFHIRVRATETELAPMFSTVQAVIVDDFHSKNLGKHLVHVQDAYLDDDGTIDGVFGEIDGKFYWNIERKADGEIVFDMNAYKGERDDYLDRTVDAPLHTTFWIEPAAIIRSMIGA